MRLGEQIAVLDGLGVIDPSDGGNYSGGSAFPDGGRIPLMPSTVGLADGDLMRAAKSIDASGGGNYSGGSAFPDGGRIPLMPSTVGLADGDLMRAVKSIDASGGGNYSGGSAFPDGGRIPLMPSTVGLAGFNAGGMQLMSTKDFQLVLQALGVKLKADGTWGDLSAKALYAFIVDGGHDEPADARVGVSSIVALAGGKQVLVPKKVLEGVVRLLAQKRGVSPKTLSGLGTLPSVLPPRRNVIDPSGGANYTGGSAFPDGGRIPLMPSTVGLADGDLMREDTRVRRGVIDPSFGVNYGGGSSYPDSGRWPLLPSSAGLAGLAAAADKLTKRRGTFIRPRLTGDTLADAGRKLMAVIASLRGILANPKETAGNKAQAQQLLTALMAVKRQLEQKRAV